MPNSKEDKSKHNAFGSPKAPKKTLYDIEKLKEIPILSVCELLSIPVENKQSRRASCKARPERTASTVLYLDTNTFHDFGGGGAGGDVIAFYAYVTGMTQGDAIQALGQAFDVTPTDPHAGMDPYELTNLEWKRLGIYGDRASKNFIFHVDRLSPERLWELSEKFNIPINDLRKQHPQTYARILKQTALPHVRALRNAYYLDVYGQYRFCASLGRPDLFQDVSYQQELLNKRDELKLAERMLTKAIHGTSITFQPEVVPDPNTLLKRLLRGEPELGTRSYKGMQALARKKECFIRYRSMDLAEYQGSDFSGIPHTAFVKGDRVSVGFLPENERQVNSILEHTKPENEYAFIPEPGNGLCQRKAENMIQKNAPEV